MIAQVWRFLRRHHRALSALLLIAFAVGALAGYRGWQSGGGEPPAEIIRTITDQCKVDPAHIPTPAAGQANYLHTCGSHVYDAHGRLVRITGVSWFGLETGSMAPDGLWARNWATILDQLAALGYNTIRIPYSNDILRPNARPTNINYLINPDLQGLTSLQILDKIVQGAHQRGLRILLDRHRPTSAAQSELWYTPQVSEQTWINDWVFLAKRYRGNDTVIGADLHNEPRGPAAWGTNDPKTDWRLAAQRAGNAILAANPYWLIFVEGIERQGNDWYWWGGNLQGVRKYPVILNIPNRVVYSPHDYGPDIYLQGWFKDPNFPNNLPGVWDQHWGYIAEEGIAPVILGEFGGRSVGSDAEGKWHRALVDYLSGHNIGFISWALNPDSGDTGGILQDDWLTVVASKQDLYSPSLAPQSKPSGSAGQGPPLRLTYHAVSRKANDPNAAFVITVFNGRSDAIKLDDLTIRYWLADNARRTEAVVDWAALGDGRVKATVKPTSCGNQSGYIELSFAAGNLAGYDTTGPIMVRYHRTDWSAVDPSHDYSYTNSTSDIPGPKVQIYQGGQLVWGNVLSC